MALSGRDLVGIAQTGSGKTISVSSMQCFQITLLEFQGHQLCRNMGWPKHVIFFFFFILELTFVLSRLCTVLLKSKLPVVLRFLRDETH